MTHLGTQISALADGRLTGAARERALCHVAACGPCAEELRATRAAREALAAAADVAPAPDLAFRLLALGSTDACPIDTAPRGAARADTAPALGGGPVLGDAVGFGAEPFGGGRLGGGRLGGSVLAGGAGARPVPVRTVAVLGVGAAVVGLFLLGDVRDVSPDSHPAADLALLAAAGSAGGGTVAVSAAESTTVPAVTGTDVDPGALEAAWPGGVLPEGYTAVATHADAGWAELDLDGPVGAVVVQRQAGHLDDDLAAQVPSVTIGDHEVHVLSDVPWHAVWQSGDAVVGVIAAHRSRAVDALVAAYPHEQVDGGIAARMSRGWQTVVGAWAP
ncbi:hypothetical protein [Actinotalea fermentans]|uniref:Zinc-finger domain-containing protein n=1 Tax=Actinotalea fermentans TaxID=43671 RepID=A0A511YWQ3_9CELL|nr:hypothetical protein [Actinotalea fermentans]KGM14962.1 hypothetical protein N867_13460 [Actinotalea fermentans ATCC 43279 = JCM 9966 = DSM 3133]GEN79618.1 hypothetical protein AFE02nite_13520 [Actinotalea fermentans]